MRLILVDDDRYQRILVSMMTDIRDDGICFKS